jgi:hypothetical protein
VLAFLYLIVAAFLMRLMGIEMTHYVATLMMAAGVMLGGTYAIVMFVWLAAHVVKRLVDRQPLGEIED